jgi:hypothetical protein
MTVVYRSGPTGASRARAPRSTSAGFVTLKSVTESVTAPADGSRVSRTTPKPDILARRAEKRDPSREPVAGFQRVTADHRFAVKL